MIKNDPSTRYWSLTCDRCGRMEELQTVSSSAQVTPKAAHLGWEMTTALGDLCPKCAKQWRLGLLDGEIPRI